MTTEQKTPDIHATVRERYGQIAANFDPGQSASCCGPSSGSGCCGPADINLSDIQIGFYETPEAASLPADVTGLSLGCGDPIALASLQPGQTVLDLGSGGGIDCFLAAQKVGPGGHVIGVDMTHEMLEKARANRQKLGFENVEFRLGEIEHLPVADNSVDVILSNCVINLSPDKPQVFREAYRVLKPGGRVAVSDIATQGPLPDEVKSSLSAWAGCVAGALDIHDYIATMEAAGFVDVQVTPVYLPPEAIDAAVAQLGTPLDPQALAQTDIYQTVFSAKVTGRKGQE